MPNRNVRPAQEFDRESWLEMRLLLWPDGTPQDFEPEMTELLEKLMLSHPPVSFKAHSGSMAILPSHVFPLMMGFAGLFLLSSCSLQTPQPTPETKVNQSQQIKLLEGSSVTLENANLEVRFVKVVSDSRCLPKMQCVWVGDAEVSFAVSIPLVGAPAQLITLHTAVSQGSDQAVAYGYRFKLLELTPRGDTPVQASLEASSAMPVKLP